ncbi:MAG: shikimate kinase, partial [Bryobacteraceae bacterium]
MASGKTTIGRLLAHELGWYFADLDDDIEAQRGMTIGEIFKQHGEREFREAEKEALRKRVRMVQAGRPHVVALGGGTFAQPQNIEILTDNGVTVWLDLPLDTVRHRLDGCEHRPLARDSPRMEELFEDRRQSYAKADFRVAIDSDDPAVTVA